MGEKESQNGGTTNLIGKDAPKESKQEVLSTRRGKRGGQAKS